MLNYQHGLTILVATCMLIACEGPVGPEGPQGAEGPTGPQGPQGPEGNANVVSDTLTVSDASWESGRIYFQTSSNGSLSRAARVHTIEIGEITEEIYNFGMVQVYFKTIEGFGSSSQVWTPLPYEILAFGGEFYYNLNYTYDVGELKLYYYYTQNSSDSSTPDVDAASIPDYTFKYVITAPATTESMAKDGVNWNNHDEVVGYLKKNNHLSGASLIREK